MSRTPARFSGRSLPAALLAVVVLVIAMAGSATAAKLITGKQIKNNTITTQDVKNQSLTGQDLKNGSVAGADLKNGSVGPADLAASAKNKVLVTDGSDLNLPTCDTTSLDQCASLVSVAPTAGTWLVIATVTVDNFGAPPTDITNQCGLVHGGDTVTGSRVPLAANGAPGESESMALQHVLTVPGGSGPISLRCTEMAGDSLRINSPIISATRVS